MNATGLWTEEVNKRARVIPARGVPPAGAARNPEPASVPPHRVFPHAAGGSRQAARRAAPGAQALADNLQPTWPTLPNFLVQARVRANQHFSWKNRNSFGLRAAFGDFHGRFRPSAALCLGRGGVPFDKI